MNFSKLITHLDRSANLFNSTQTTQILYPQRRKKIWDWDYTTETAQTTYLTDKKNIYTQRFEPIQRLQPNFITDGIRNFMAQ